MPTYVGMSYKLVAFGYPATSNYTNINIALVPLITNNTLFTTTIDEYSYNKYSNDRQFHCKLNDLKKLRTYLKISK